MFLSENEKAFAPDEAVGLDDLANIIKHTIRFEDMEIIANGWRHTSMTEEAKNRCRTYDQRRKRFRDLAKEKQLVLKAFE